MRGNGTTGTDGWGRSRGVSPALTYVLAIGIVTILISGLLVATTGFVDSERAQVVRDELEIVGERLAADAVAVDRLAVDASVPGEQVTQRTTVPRRVAGVGYYVAVVDCPAGEACLSLSSADPSLDVTVTVPVNNQSRITVSRADPRTVRIGVAAGSDPVADADADRSVPSTIGVGRDVQPGLQSSGSLFEASTAPVVSGVSYTPSPPPLGETVTFESDVTTFVDGEYTYEWDLDGDGTYETTGNASTASAVNTTYTSPGRYDVSLRVTGPSNQSDTVTKLIRVSGLVLLDPDDGPSATDTDGGGATAGVSFDLRNNFTAESVEITDIGVDPADDGVDRLYNPNGSEVSFDGTGSYDVDDPDEAVVLYDGGTLVSLDTPSDDTGTSGSIPAGDTTTVAIGEFYDDTDAGDVDSQYATENESFDVAVRYETSGQANYVTRFRITPDGTVDTGGTPDPSPQPPTLDGTGFQCQYDDYFDEVDVTADDPNGDLSSVTLYAWSDVDAGNDDYLGYDSQSYPSNGGTRTVGNYGGVSYSIEYVELVVRDDDGRTVVEGYEIDEVCS
jgi:hypothetical protein